MELVKPDWGLIIFMLLTLSGAIAVGVFFLLNLQGALSQCAPETRRMPPGQVWLILIPLFGIVWMFVVVNRIADSLATEFKRRQLPLDTARPGYAVGLVMSIAGCGGIIRNIGKYAQISELYWFGIAIAFVMIVLMIVYWVQIADYKKQLIRSGHHMQHFNNPYQNPPQGYGNYNQQGYGTPYGQNNYPPQHYGYPNTTPSPPPTNPNDHSRWMPPRSN
jgi:hypothetical protein